MHPLCLLTKGRTFRDTADRSGAYKVVVGKAPPKFAAARRALSAPPHPLPQPAQKSLFEPPRPAPKPVVVAPRQPVAPPAEPARPLSTLASPFAPGATKAGATIGTGPLRRAAGLCQGWVQRFVFGRTRRAPGGATVQPELALEKVTVMRNDLHEDDLEVVLVQRRVGNGEKPLARLSKLEMTGEAWLRLTAAFRKKSNESAFSPKAETKPSPELSAPV
jgi:hypothetical protein